MKAQKVVKWLKRGYPHLKEESRLPVWILPEHSFDKVADELGDYRILEVSQPLSFADGVEDLFEKAPEPETVSVEAWQMALMQWPPLLQVRPMVEACLESTAMIVRHFQSSQPKVEPVMVCRSMAVLGFALFVPRGEPLLAELGSILQDDTNEAAGLIRRYAQAVLHGDTLTIGHVDDCIARHSQWVEWAALFIGGGQSLSCTPKLVAVTPPVSTELVYVLAEMIKETGDDESRRDYPQYPASNISAQ
jgi:hypothetical protein